MAEIVNLRRVKKARARQEAAVEAARNRVEHGRSRAEREAGRAAREQVERGLDGARLDRDGEPPE